MYIDLLLFFFLDGLTGGSWRLGTILEIETETWVTKGYAEEIDISRAIRGTFWSLLCALRIPPLPKLTCVYEVTSRLLSGPRWSYSISIPGHDVAALSTSRLYFLGIFDAETRSLAAPFVRNMRDLISVY